MKLVVKSIAVYGSYKAKVPVRQRYWKRRKDGIKQRYWKKTTRKKMVVASGRYEFYGKGKDLYKALLKAQKIMPKGYVKVAAEKFVKKPQDYGFEGVWIDSEVESA